MQNATINVNGQILNSDDAKISVFDRGYLYGDSLYEVTRSYGGQFFKLDEHLNRMEKSAELCRMVLGQSLKTYREEIYRTFQVFKAQPQNKNSEAYVRIIVSRGIGKIGFSLNCLLSSTQYTIIVQPVESPSPEKIKKGMKIKVTERLRNDRRALDPAMKSGNYLNSLLAYLEAEADQYEDAVLCNAEGHITEGTTFNIFYAKRGILATPPLDIGILDGITRRHILKLTQKLNIPLREVRFSKDRLYEADEVFISSSLKEVLAVTQIDGKKIGDGTPGPITLKLHQSYRDFIKEGLQ